MTDLGPRVLRRVRRSLSGLGTPHLSVVVVVSGPSPHLEEALASVAAVDEPIEVVLAARPADPEARAAVLRVRGPASRWRLSAGPVRIVEPGSGRSWLDAAADAARGEWLAFLPADDVVPPGSYESMLTSLRVSGSDLALGVHVDVRGDRRRRVPWAEDVVRPGTSVRLSDRPGLLVDLAPTGKLVRRDRWRAARTTPASWAGAPATVARVMLGADGIDVLDRVVHEVHDRQTSLPVGEQDRFRADLLAARCSGWGQVTASLATEQPALREAWLLGALTHLLPPTYRDAVGGGPAYAEVLLPWMRTLLDQVPEPLLARVPLGQRLGAWSAGTGRLADVALAADHLADHPHGLPTTRTGSGAVADPPAGLAEPPPEHWRRVEEVDRRLRSRVTLTASAPGRFELRGAAFLEHTATDGLPVVRVAAVTGGAEGVLPVRRPAVPEPDLDLWAARAHEDHADCGFTVSLGTADLPGPGPWWVRVELGGRSHRHRVPVPPSRSEARPAGDPLRVGGLRLVADRLRLDVGGGPRFRWRLAGTRAVTDWSQAGSADLEVPLVVDQLGRRTLLPGGDYRLEADRRPRHGLVLDPGGPIELSGDRIRLVARASGTGVRLSVTSPPDSSARSARGQQRLLDEVYRPGRGVSRGGAASTVLLETFRGRGVGDNPGAIGRELLASPRAVFAGLEVAVVVDDPSVPVPDGTRAVVRSSRDWYATQAGAGLLVSNAGAPYWFAKAPGQLHVQTWHGTPLKRIGEDRGPGDFATWRHRRRIAEQARGWDAMVSPSPYVSDIYRSAFGFEGTVLEVGYPRNDVLLSPGRDRVRAEVRARLGLLGTDRVVLYAPTWREYVGVREAKPMYLDPEELVRALPGAVVLVRGHYNGTHLDDVFVSHPRIHDVTRYPDIADLFLAADALVTDYSSVMFDFVLTDRPVVLLVPDLEQYRDVERGFYFDIEEHGPGPLVTTTAEVAQVLSAPDRRADQRADFRAAFCPYEDGQASARVVEYCLDRLTGTSSSATPTERSP